MKNRNQSDNIYPVEDFDPEKEERVSLFIGIALIVIWVLSYLVFFI